MYLDINVYLADLSVEVEVPELMLPDLNVDVPGHQRLSRGPQR